MVAIAELMDGESGGRLYQDALDKQIEKFQDPENCPSARLLRELRDSDTSFLAFSERQARKFQEEFLREPLSKEQQAEFDRVAEQSLRDQAAIEANDTLSLDDYIKAYLDQASD